MVSARWIAPGEALAGHRARELVLPLPTQGILASLVRAPGRRRPPGGRPRAGGPARSARGSSASPARSGSSFRRIPAGSDRGRRRPSGRIASGIPMADRERAWRRDHARARRRHAWGLAARPAGGREGGQTDAPAAESARPGRPIPPAGAPVHGMPKGWRFTLPKGDPAKGRGVFQKLECYSCHEVRGERFPTPNDPGRAGPELSVMGRSTRPSSSPSRSSTPAPCRAEPWIRRGRRILEDAVLRRRDDASRRRSTSSRTSGSSGPRRGSRPAATARTTP